MYERMISNLGRLKMTVKSPNSVAYFKLETMVSAVYCLILLGRNSYKFLSEKSRFTDKQRPRKKKLSKVTPSVSDQVRQKKDLTVPILWTTQLHHLLPFCPSRFHNCTPSFLEEVVLSNGPSLLLSGLRLVNPHTNR